MDPAVEGVPQGAGAGPVSDPQYPTTAPPEPQDPAWERMVPRYYENGLVIRRPPWWRRALAWLRRLFPRPW